MAGGWSCASWAETKSAWAARLGIDLQPWQAETPGVFAGPPPWPNLRDKNVLKMDRNDRNDRAIRAC